MSRARLMLHLVALAAPFTVAAFWCLMLWSTYGGFPFWQWLLFGSAGALPAEIATMLCWHWLDARARAGSGAWRVGLGMAAITHALFGAALVAFVLMPIGGERPYGNLSDWVMPAIVFVVMSIFAVGAFTFPLTAGVAEWIAALRRRELARAPSAPADAAAANGEISNE